MPEDKDPKPVRPLGDVETPGKPEDVPPVRPRDEPVPTEPGDVETPGKSGG